MDWPAYPHRPPPLAVGGYVPAGAALRLDDGCPLGHGEPPPDRSWVTTELIGARRKRQR